jgi:hypothetical protein
MAKKDQQEQVVTEEQAQPAAPSLTLQDLVLVAQIIQLTTQRGAYRAEELEQVGGLYNKLVAFLQSTGALSPAPTADAPAAPTGDQ